MIVSNVKEWMDTFIFYLEGLDYKLPIYIGKIPDDDIDYIYFNSEQLTRTSELNLLLERIQTRKPKEIWDYSRKNVDILNEKNVMNIRHINIQSPKWYTDQLKSYRIRMLYDVGFCGTLSLRRLHILNQLKEKGLTVCIINTWGNERDRSLACCRTLINIHYGDDYKIFESARCEPWLSIMPVISENSLDNDDRCINVPYDELVMTTRRIVQLAYDDLELASS